MNILHYTLGLPPIRSGGLTKYATDLMLLQREQGFNVGVIYAGGLNIYFPKKKIIQNKTWNNILNFEIKNPSIIPLLHGIKNPSQITNVKNRLSEDQIDILLKKIYPDIFHIHTFMGLPLELVKFLKDKGTKIIFSTHDYYGLCMKVFFINEKGALCSSPNGANCALCNYNAPSSLFLRIRNSRLLLSIKNELSQSHLLRQIAKTASQMPNQIKPNISLAKEQEYQLLINYYKSIFPLVDSFHFNSEVTKEVYSQYIDTTKSEVIPISHSEINDNRQIKKFNRTIIRITFIGNIDEYKGFPILKKILLELSSHSNWVLKVWSNTSKTKDQDSIKIEYCGKYNSDQIRDIYASTDILVVPSICKETFSLVTLEALSFGVPVLVSSNVGAKDIVKSYYPEFVYETETDLKQMLCTIFKNVSLLTEYNKRIVALPWKYSFQQHIDKVTNLYKKAII